MSAESGPKQLIVTGHSLIAEGAPHNDAGRIVGRGQGWGSTGGTGRAKCTCGQMSEPLSSGYKRKAWHRAHKIEVQSQRDRAFLNRKAPAS